MKKQETTSSSLDVKIAPGELLPVSVKLVNFGSSKRVDVNVTYSIVSETGSEVYQSSDTVAVDVTNNFIKPIQIPFDTKSGIYTETTSILYPGQISPATSGFKFNIERKFMGVFEGQLFLYGIFTLFLGIVTVLSIYFLVKRRERFL